MSCAIGHNKLSYSSPSSAKKCLYIQHHSRSQIAFPEAGFSDDLSKLKLHLGRAGPTKFDSLKKEKILVL